MRVGQFIGKTIYVKNPDDTVKKLVTVKDDEYGTSHANIYGTPQKVEYHKKNKSSLYRRQGFDSVRSKRKVSIQSARDMTRKRPAREQDNSKPSPQENRVPVALTQSGARGAQTQKSVINERGKNSFTDFLDVDTTRRIPTIAIEEFRSSNGSTIQNTTTIQRTITSPISITALHNNRLKSA